MISLILFFKNKYQLYFVSSCFFIKVITKVLKIFISISMEISFMHATFKPTFFFNFSIKVEFRGISFESAIFLVANTMLAKCSGDRSNKPINFKAAIQNTFIIISCVSDNLAKTIGFASPNLASNGSFLAIKLKFLLLCKWKIIESNFTVFYQFI